MRSTVLYYKWPAPLTKLYPMGHGRTGQREHLTFRHPPKTQILREDKASVRVVRNRKLAEGAILA